MVMDHERNKWDEVPLFLCKKNLNQVSKRNERIQIRAPPIVGHDKYRDATFIPFINNINLLFLVVIIKGGITI